MLKVGMTVDSLVVGKHFDIFNTNLVVVSILISCVITVCKWFHSVVSLMVLELTRLP